MPAGNGPARLGAVLTLCPFPVNGNCPPPGFSAQCSKARVPPGSHQLPSTSRVPGAWPPHAAGSQGCVRPDAGARLQKRPSMSTALRPPRRAPRSAAEEGPPLLGRAGSPRLPPCGHRLFWGEPSLPSGREGSLTPHPSYSVGISPRTGGFCVRSSACSSTHEPSKLCLTVTSINLAFPTTCAALSKGGSQVSNRREGPLLGSDARQQPLGGRGPRDAGPNALALPSSRPRCTSHFHFSLPACIYTHTW